MTLSFELEPEHGQLRVFADEDGLRLLKREIEFLLSGETHSHLSTPEWGGNELDSGSHAEGYRSLDQVKITRIPAS